MFVIPDEYRNNARTSYGDAWLDQLSATLTRCEHRWKLTFAPPFAYQSYAYHYITPATRDDGTSVVVKVHAPTREFPLEVAALRLYAGRGIAHLLDIDMEGKALLHSTNQKAPSIHGGDEWLFLVWGVSGAGR